MYYYDTHVNVFDKSIWNRFHICESSEGENVNSWSLLLIVCSSSSSSSSKSTQFERTDKLINALTCPKFAAWR